MTRFFSATQVFTHRLLGLFVAVVLLTSGASARSRDLSAPVDSAPTYTVQVSPTTDAVSERTFTLVGSSDSTASYQWQQPTNGVRALLVN